jgi:small conductance mechanosensitive channel
LDISDLIVKLTSVTAIIVATYLFARLFQAAVGRLLRASVPIVRIQTERLVYFATWAIGLLVAVQQLGIVIDIIELLVAIVALAFLFAYRESLENIGAKYFSDIYLPFKVGDEISIKGTSGRVIEINPICTVLLTADEHLASFPNSIFLREHFVNLSKVAWKEVNIPVVIQNDVDLAEFESQVLRACSKLKMYWDERFPPFFTTRNRDAKNAELVLTLMLRSPDKKDVAVAEVNKRISDIIQKLKSKQPATEPS